MRQRLKNIRPDNYGAYRDVSLPPSLHHNEAIMEASYFSGFLHIQNTKELIKRIFGEEFVEKNKAKLNRALATGGWSWEVYPEFVIWFLKGNL